MSVEIYSILWTKALDRLSDASTATNMTTICCLKIMNLSCSLLLYKVNTQTSQIDLSLH